MSGFKIKDKDLAGFDLAGWIGNGLIRIDGSDRHISKWPNEITFNGNTFTLEEVIDGHVSAETGLKFQNAIYA